jgi:hypothetical protein
MDEHRVIRFRRFFLYFSLCLFVAIGIITLFLNEQGTFNERDKKNTCINNLRLIDAAKQQWALEHGTNSATPTWENIKSYIGRPDSEILEYPLGGTYTLGKLNEDPTCSIPGHVLPKH